MAFASKVILDITGKLLDIVQPMLQNTIYDGRIHRKIFVYNNIAKTRHWRDTLRKIIRDNTGGSQLADRDTRIIWDCLPRPCDQMIRDISDVLYENLQGVKQSVPLHPILG